MTSLDEVGIHLAAHLYDGCSTKELVEVARQAREAGFDRVSISDNLRARNPFVILAAIASKVPVQLGTAVLVPYFRNPLDVASSLAAITEIAGGEDLSVGIARGSHLQTSRNVQVVKPLEVLKETVLFMKKLLSAQEVDFDDYPAIASYFNMRPGGKARLDFRTERPVKIYCGGNGPKTLRVAGEVTDGLIFGGQFIPFLTTMKIRGLLDIYDGAASRAGRTERPVHTGLMAISIGKSAKAARDFARPNVASSFISMKIMGFTNDDFEAMGVEPTSVDRLIKASDKQLPVAQVVKFVTDKMVDATYVAGAADDCRDRFVELCETSKRAGVRRIAFSKLGPDPKRSVEVIAKQILPAVA